ncbi:MAG: hypothetical protein HY799_11735 [Nitrosomonadales bacterium]|nr:hypothetical protein [Nitrosomonadales bacterium]
MIDVPATEKFERLSQVADAELGVAEELGWAIAVFAALATYLKWESWLLTAAVGVSAYVLAIYRYRKRAAVAEDIYYRAAGLGKYAGKRERGDA